MGSSEGPSHVESDWYLWIWQQLHHMAYVAVLLINNIAGHRSNFKYDFQRVSDKTMAFLLLVAN